MPGLTWKESIWVQCPHFFCADWPLEGRVKLSRWDWLSSGLGESGLKSVTIGGCCEECYIWIVANQICHLIFLHCTVELIKMMAILLLNNHQISTEFSSLCEAYSIVQLFSLHWHAPLRLWGSELVLGLLAVINSQDSFSLIRGAQQRLPCGYRTQTQSDRHQSFSSIYILLNSTLKPILNRPTASYREKWVLWFPSWHFVLQCLQSPCMIELKKMHTSDSISICYYSISMVNQLLNQWSLESYMSSSVNSVFLYILLKSCLTAPSIDRVSASISFENHWPDHVHMIAPDTSNPSASLQLIDCWLVGAYLCGLRGKRDWWGLLTEVT